MNALIVLAVAWELAAGSSLAKVRPDKPLPRGVFGATSLRLDAARGECESAQVVVTAKEAAVRRVNVRATPPRMGKHALATSLYRIAFVPVQTPSNTEGAAGRWPDALVPSVDPDTNERRNAFPFDVRATEHQPVLVEVCTRVDTLPGVYAGEVVVDAEGTTKKLALDVHVHKAVVPVTSTYPTTFGLSGKSLEFGHYGEKKGDEARLELVHKYAKEALRHRVSLHSMSMLPPAVTRGEDGLSVDFSTWDAEIGPYLDGTALPSGAKFTAIDLRVPPGLSGKEFERYLRLVEEHFRARGWVERLFSYVMDEPKASDEPELVRRLEALRAAPAIRRLVTTGFDPALSTLVNLWVPNLNCLFIRRKSGELCARHPSRGSYRPAEAQGALLWWYQSCSSHGCGSGPFGNRALDEYFSGWPSYMVDASGERARAMGWLGFQNDIGGELYFDMAFAFNGAPDKDPWDGVWAFGGNGDGTLFYPGRPERIGGTTHAPVASLRLKHIRDGLEDLELLRLLASKPGGRDKALALARTLVPMPWRIEPDVRRWENAHRLLLESVSD